MMKYERQLSELNSGHCGFCSRDWRENRHVLNKALIDSLEKLAAMGLGWWSIVEAGITDYSERSNFQKLKYFRFVESMPERAGIWQIREPAIGFLFHGGRAWSHVVTYYDEIDRYEGNQITRENIQLPIPNYEWYKSGGLNPWVSWDMVTA